MQPTVLTPGTFIRWAEETTKHLRSFVQRQTILGLISFIEVQQRYRECCSPSPTLREPSSAGSHSWAPGFGACCHDGACTNCA